MSKFLNQLRVVQLNDRLWELTAPLMYWSDSLFKILTVPDGFNTDFASVPRLPLAYLLTGGKASAPAVIHDWLYATQEYPRATADAVFYEAIRASGHSAFTAWLMWGGVRVGGGVGWKAPNLPQPANVNLPDKEAP